MQIDLGRPNKLYRYSERKWLERSLREGEFRLRPASHYQIIETDRARSDDERRRKFVQPASSVTITNITTGQRMLPVGDVTFVSEIGTDYLVLCLADRWGTHFFEDFTGSDACLVIHDTEQFCERIHAEADRVLPGWFGIDGPVTYGSKSQLGVAFTKPNSFMFQFEWRFAWRPSTPTATVEPAFVRIGNIEDIAGIVDRPVRS